MAYGLVQTVAPTGEPVSLEDAKLYLRVDTDITEDDRLVTALIAAARQKVEIETGRQLLTASWRLTLDYWPWPNATHPIGGPGWSNYTTRQIRLPRPPVQSVTSITYVDYAGTTQTLATDQYLVDTSRQIPLIEPAFGKYWQPVRPQANAINVTYVAGYGAAIDVPEALRQAILLLVGLWYEQRAAAAVGILTPVPLAVESILGNYWVGEYGEYR